MGLFQYYRIKKKRPKTDKPNTGNGKDGSGGNKQNKYRPRTTEDIIADISSRNGWTYEYITSFSESAMIYLWTEWQHEEWHNRGLIVKTKQQTEQEQREALKMWGK